MRSRRSITVFPPVFVIALLFFSSEHVGSQEPPEPIYRADSINVYEVATGFQAPLSIAATGIEGDKRLFVGERVGLIKILEEGEIFEVPFLDLSSKISLEVERGFQSFVFDPDFAENGYFYVNYTSSDPTKYGDSIISRFQVTADQNIANPNSEFIILEVKQTDGSHNGGHLAFDSTNNLIIGFGDGGGTLDEVVAATQKDSLLGKMVRINVHGVGGEPSKGCGRVKNYHIPRDNPKPNGEDGWCPEILSSGWRNPWRYSMDPVNGKMWVGDVGEDRFEEINIVPRTTTVLRSYGWPCFEGWTSYITGCAVEDDAIYTSPSQVYARETPGGDFLGSSITGGIIYQGELFREYDNNYFFADFISGNIWAIDILQHFIYEPQLVYASSSKISTFGMDSANELYFADLISGSIYQIMGHHAIEIQVDAPKLVRSDSIATWNVSIKNIGSKTISQLSVSTPLPVGVDWESGGKIEKRQLVLDFADIEPSQTIAQHWEGYIPGDQLLIANSTYKPEFDGKLYTVNQDKIEDTLVFDAPTYIYLPVVR